MGLTGVDIVVCDPGSNTLNPPSVGSIPGLGLGPILGPYSPPIPNFSLPAGVPEDIVALVENLLANIPGGILRPNPDNFMKDIWDAVAGLLNELAPFLAFYNFFQALLQMIACIIDVICALLKPRKLKRAVTRLFKQCLPAFINLFPWIALLAMILALILLLIALIEYIINKILAFIRDIIRNLEYLGDAIAADRAQAVLAITSKIAYLLCLIEQFFAIFVALGAIFEIIKALAALSGTTFCLSGSDDCCTEDVCPEFLQQDGLINTANGYLVYYNEVQQDNSGLPVPVSLPLLRTEKWQIYDNNTGATYSISDIITSIDDNIFWPQPLTFQGTTSTRKVPYLVDLRIFYDPSVFDTSVSGTGRWIRLNDVIIEQEPYIGVVVYDNDRISPPGQTGTARLVGGKAFEDDGTTPINVGGSQASIEDVIHFNPDVRSSLPSTDDGYYFPNMQFTIHPVYEALFDYKVINLMCDPDLAGESAVLNATFDFASADDKLRSQIPDTTDDGVFLPTLPDIGSIDPPTGALGCLTESLATFRANVSIENAAVFQSQVEECLGTLRTEAVESGKGAIKASIDVFTTEATLDPDLQFVKNPITVTVTLQDANGIILSNSLPSDFDEIQELIEGTVTVGTISDFTYDGNQSYTAEINSDIPGQGELRIFVNSQQLSEILNRDNEDEATSIQERVLEYQFIGVTAGRDEPQVRRDEGDTARTGG